MPEPRRRAGPEVPVHKLLGELRAGERRKLSATDRARCVHLLWDEGETVPEMAQLLQVSERTITRDRNAIREQCAIEVGEPLRARLLFDLVRQAEISVSNLRRLGRDSNASIAERAAINVHIIDVVAKTVQSCASLGAFPAPPEATAPESLDALIVQVLHIATVAEGDGTDPELRSDIRALVARLTSVRGGG